MAAPKNWGYTRDSSFCDEMLVSWTDGDLTEALTREVVERLLCHGDERQRAADWAGAAQRSTLFKGKDWIVDPPAAVVQACKAL
jgi:hypothetical protein